MTGGDDGLRWYQREAIRGVYDAFRSGARSVALQLPTGAGKSHAAIGGLIVPSVRAGNLVAFAADTAELVDDAAKRLRDAGLRTGIIQADRPRDPGAAVFAASVQTLVARSAEELPAFTRIVIDEAHIAGAPTIRALLDRWPAARIVGLSATARRGAGPRRLVSCPVARMQERRRRARLPGATPVARGRRHARAPRLRGPVRRRRPRGGRAGEGREPMSRSAEAFASSPRGGAAWRDVSPSRRCPVCDRGSWCQVSRDSRVALCKRVAEGGHEKINRDGVVFHVHTLDVAARPEPRRDVWSPEGPDAECANLAVRDRAYRSLLAALPLAAEHRADLTRRGLDAERIARNVYRSLPDDRRERERAAAAVVEAVGEGAAAGVPGMVQRHGRWTIAGWHGLLIPVRAPDGCVEALKVRCSDERAPRYSFVSSASRGGPRAVAAVHHPLDAMAMRGSARVCAVSEGPLKSDLATALLNLPVLGVPGVGRWREGAAAVIAYGAERAAVALDMDTDNPLVAAATQNMLRELRRAGARAEWWRWPAERKGIDDQALFLKGNK